MRYNPLISKNTPNNWQVMRLEEVSNFVSRGKQPKYVELSNIYTLNQKAIRWGSIQHENLRYHNPDFPVDEKYFIKKNDIVLNSTGVGTVGRVFHFAHTPKVRMFADSHVTIIRSEEEVLRSKFLYYQLSDVRFQSYILNTLLAGSTGQVELNKSKIMGMEILIPTIEEQDKIVDKLRYLDSKIELNNQIISNLEELASTLFKRWFVDFEFPDENENPYKSSGGKMVDSELGEIPERWEIIKLSDLVVQIKETFNPNKTEVEKVNHFSIPNFDSKKFPVIEDVNTIKSNKTKITDFTVLFSKMNPNFERVWLTELNKSYLNVCSPEFIALDCTNINLQTYTYFLCKSTAFNRFLVNNATGSTGSRQRIKPSIAMGFKFAGSVDLINKYGEICSGISEQITNLRNQIENLKENRDSLLPKLLSGEIELPEDGEV